MNERAYQSCTPSCQMSPPTCCCPQNMKTFKSVKDVAPFPAATLHSNPLTAHLKNHNREDMKFQQSEEKNEWLCGLGRAAQQRGVRAPLPTPSQLGIGCSPIAGACSQAAHFSHGPHCANG